MALESLLLPIFERLLYDKYSSNVPHHQRCHSSSSEMMRNVFDYVIFLVVLFFSYLTLMNYLASEDILKENILAKLIDCMNWH